MENMAFIKMDEYQELLKKSKAYDEASAETNMFTKFLRETGRLTKDVIKDYEMWKNKPRQSNMTNLGDIPIIGDK